MDGWHVREWTGTHRLDMQSEGLVDALRNLLRALAGVRNCAAAAHGFGHAGVSVEGGAVRLKQLYGQTYRQTQTQTDRGSE